MYNKEKAIKWLILNKHLTKNEAAKLEFLATLKLLKSNKKFIQKFSKEIVK